ncbi:MAG: HAMP domain-containing histidine kinase [Azonexaceae bacterium]|nr:HAMP domain-containing histidine kinase [Azonexaceae bacterium]
MRFLTSLHAKILIGYAVVGILFVGFIVNSLIQFRLLRAELGKQADIVVFFDILRDARRLEKNFLLYEKKTDLNEAIDKAGSATQLLSNIEVGQNTVSVGEARAVSAYRDRLIELVRAEGEKSVPQDLLKAVYLTGSAALRVGERLNAAAQQSVQAALLRHETNLQRSIWAGLLLGLIIGVLVTRSVVRPIREIERNLQKIAKGETGRLAGNDLGDEVASLAQSINDTLQELEARQKAVAQSSRLVALGTMLSGVAHELNNPLSNISSSCQILFEEWQELPSDQIQRLLSQIDNQVLRSQRIVSSLSNDPESKALHRTKENVYRLTKEATELLRNQVLPTVTITIDADREIEAMVDRTRFQQVLINVIKNAAEAVKADGNIIIRAWREVFPEGRGTTWEIEDDGTGITDAVAQRIFDPFYTTKPTGQGVGLGLFVAHEIVSQHDGIITAEGAPGGGTRVWIHVPDQSHSNETEDTPAELPPESHESKAKQ